MEEKEVCFLGEATQMNNRSPYSEHLAKIDIEKDTAHIGLTWMLNHRENSFGWQQWC